MHQATHTSHNDSWVWMPDKPEDLLGLGFSWGSGRFLGSGHFFLIHSLDVDRSQPPSETDLRRQGMSVASQLMCTLSQPTQKGSVSWIVISTVRYIWCTCFNHIFVLIQFNSRYLSSDLFLKLNIKHLHLGYETFCGPHTDAPAVAGVGRITYVSFPVPLLLSLKSLRIVSIPGILYKSYSLRYTGLVLLPV